MTLTRTTPALAFGIGLSFVAGPLALAAGAGCPQRSDQEQFRNPPFFAEKAGQQQVGQNTSQGQKADQEQFRNPPFFAKAGEQQVGQNTSEAQKAAGSSGPGPLQYRQQTASTDSTTAQKAAQEQSGTRVASNCR